MSGILGQLEQLARETKKSESELMTLAFETGLRQLWRQRALDRYLRRETSREEAIADAGMEWVELAERQREAILQDIEWARGR
ncbi:MAG TPA: hypothetical protein VEK08_01250 [Planctomycetota bacterium]|nr:hypothetical protein [Planctomycetota bacterium]